MDKKQDVVITGAGVISPLGNGKNKFWNALRNGEQCFSKITLFDSSKFNISIAGEIKNFDPLIFFEKRKIKDLDRSTILVCAAAKLAIEDSGIIIDNDNTHQVGVSIGATFGSLHSISQFDLTSLREGPRFVNPSHFPNTVINSPASRISILFNIKGFNTTISTGFCAGLDSIIYASDFIKLGRADAVLAGGVEELCEETFLCFHTLEFLSGCDGSEPLSCPYDKRRKGFIFSEGSAVIVLESEEHAIKRGATILARITGYGSAFEPEGDIGFDKKSGGLELAIKEALKQAHLEPEDIDYICGAANSTPGLDRMETEAIKNVFKDYAYKIPVSSIKSMLGETFSASGTFSLVAAVGAIVEGFIPPTVNYLIKDPECDLDYVPNISRTASIKRVLVLSSDPYGQNSAVIIERPE
ncbi:MAG: beta-ketoacyl-[acyl-carrier-protein] synthase family protein [Thermodesulfovibrionales bacterium]|nr:beta-ketoacyl-[acyl-carrier-protein] synthase family protein [Thermodesulfovibrionales bacterium]